MTRSTRSRRFPPGRIPGGFAGSNAAFPTGDPPPGILRVPIRLILSIALASALLLPGVAQSGDLAAALAALDDGKRKAIVDAFADLNQLQRLANTALKEGKPDQIVKISRAAGSLSQAARFIGGIDKQSDAYDILWHCEYAQSKLSLMMIVAEGLATGQKEASKIQFLSNAQQFPAYFNICQTGFGARAGVILDRNIVAAFGGKL